MTRVCLLGAEDVDVHADLLAYETARGALSSYGLSEPYENALCLSTISVGAAVSLLNDLNWYLVRLVSAAIVLEPSVSESEWLSRALATAIRNDEVEPDETGDLLKVYGVLDPYREGEREGEEKAVGQPHGDDRSTPVGPATEPGEAEADVDPGTVSETGPDADPDPDGEAGAGGPGGSRDDREALPRLTEPMYVRRVGDEVPAYDLREVDDTLVVRVTPDEFGA